MTEKEYQFKLRTGRETDKESLRAVLEDCFKNANSEKEFLEQLKERKMKTYERNGKTTGLIFNGQKYRLGRFGFTEDKFVTIGIKDIRKEYLSQIRKTDLEKGIGKSR